LKVKFLKVLGTWRDIADSARTTVHKEAGDGEPSSLWKRRMLLCEHSPIRQLFIKWKWYDLLWWVQTHFTRHWLGVEWFVSTSRSDRTGIDRKTLDQDSPVNVEGIANAQAIINISRKRLCKQASPETRQAWIEVLNSFKEYEPELYEVSVPDCIYRGYCYEHKTCGWFWTKEYEEMLREYRKDINIRKENKNANII